jgi:para-aminobenzoate synthetase/4-amino-4-deoxychorismate lyase
VSALVHHAAVFAIPVFPVPASDPASPVSACIDFVGAADGTLPLRVAFAGARRTWVARHAQEVPSVLDAAEREAREGRWCVGFVRYEAAAAFEPKAALHPADGPLAWFAAHDAPRPWPAAAGQGHAPLHWQGMLERPLFERQVSRIHQAIAEGEVYQVNLTAMQAAAFEGDGLALFEALRRAQPEAYAAYLDTGEERILSVSPELFFDWRGGRLLCRPMKGTAPRGLTPEQDRDRAAGLTASEKERAENLMIVDLIRNDLSRVAEPFSVQAQPLFEARAWPTVWQMTSDIAARTRPGTTLSQVFRALFPCGSVTGAPKLRAMHWIRELEPGPRGVYCGAIGVLQPGGAATFSVAIRTVVVRGGEARCGIGSGITADAAAAAEWQEWQHKRGFLERAAEPFELLQTLRLHEGTWPAAALHLARLEAAAAHFRLCFDRAGAEAALADVAARHTAGDWRVRLRVDALGRAQAQAFPFTPGDAAVRVQLAPAPIEAPAEFLRHKTTRRDHYERFALTQPEVFDTLLWNAHGEITEFTRGNVIAELDDGRRITPPLHCGLLDGVGRALALQSGQVVEAVLRREALQGVRRLWFVNALRGWLPATLQARDL